MVAEEIKKSRTCKHGTHKIKGHKSTKYKDLQRFKTQTTQTKTQHPDNLVSVVYIFSQVIFHDKMILVI